MKLIILGLLILLSSSQIALAAASEETGKEEPSKRKVKATEKEDPSRGKSRVKKTDEEEEDIAVANDAVEPHDNSDNLEEKPNPADEEEEALAAGHE